MNKMPIINKQNEIRKQFLNEVYVGKTKDLLHIEDLIRKIRINHNYNILNPSCNTDKEMLEIDRTFEKIFGFRNFALDVVPNYTMNAGTYSIHSRVDQDSLKKYVLKTDEGGFKYSKEAEADIYVQIFSGLFMDRDVSEAEILGILLHEVGHNFETAISTRREMFTFEKYGIFFLEIISLILNIINNPFDVKNNLTSLKGVSLTEKKSAEKYIELMKKRQGSDFFKFLDNIRGFINILTAPLKEILTLIGTLISIVNPLNIIAALFTKLLAMSVDDDDNSGSNKALTFILAPLVAIVSAIQNPIGTIGGLIGRFKGETVADNFATIYGYGSELNSALVKAGDKKGRSSFLVSHIKDSFIGNYIDFISLPPRLLLAIADEHPEEAFRLADQATYLKQELNKKDLDPKMKKEILDQVNDIEKQFVKFYKNASEEDCRKNSKQLSWAMYKLFNGEIRSDIAKSNYEEIEEAYKKAEKEK